MHAARRGAIGLVMAVVAVATGLVLGPAPVAEAGTFPAAITNVQISPTGQPAVCWQAANATNQAFISLQTCSATQTLQRCTVTTDDRVLLNQNPSLCLDNFANFPFNDARPLNITNVCSSGATNATWPYALRASGSVPAGGFVNTYAGLCANAAGGSFSPGTAVIRFSCSAPPRAP